MKLLHIAGEQVTSSIAEIGALYAEFIEDQAKSLVSLS
jgi:hypothetical protein